MTTQPTSPAVDPFAGGDKAPALTFPTPGTSYTGVVTEPARLVQSRDYETNQPATWPDGNPKMAAVVNLEVGGEPRSLWASKPSALFQAIKEAQQKAGVQIGAGGTLSVTFTHETPHPTNPRMNGVKQYTVQYQPPNAFADDNAPQVPGVANPTNDQMLDAWASGGAQQPAQQPAPASTGPDLSQAPAGFDPAKWAAMSAEARAAVLQAMA